MLHKPGDFSDNILHYTQIIEHINDWTKKNNDRSYLDISNEKNSLVSIWKKVYFEYKEMILISFTKDKYGSRISVTKWKSNRLFLSYPIEDAITVWISILLFREIQKIENLFPDVWRYKPKEIELQRNKILFAIESIFPSQRNDTYIDNQYSSPTYSMRIFWTY